MAEALSCGLPALISDKVNIWREIDQAGAGFVDTDDVVGTKRSLDRWMGLADDERDAMRRCARQCFDRNFKIETAARALIETIRNHGVISRSQPAETPSSGGIS